MRKIILAAIAAIVFPVAALAQSATLPNAPLNFYAGGVSYSVNGSPAVAGTALYAHNLDPKQSLSTYAFTVIDALPASLKPFTVSTNTGVGVAQDLTKFGKATVWIPTAAGIAWSGTNTGWQWTGGVAVTIPVKTNWYVVPSVRFLKSSVSGGSGYQPIIGVMVGFGK
jgi:hypothetical protein